MRYLSILLISLFHLTGHAEDSVTNNIDTYQVEVIIFNNADKNSLQSELWPGYPAMPDVKDSTELSEYTEEQPDTYQGLPDSFFKLKTLAKRLNSSGHHVFDHVAWTQPLESANSKTIHITDQRFFDGIVSIKKEQSIMANVHFLFALNSLEQRQLAFRPHNHQPILSLQEQRRIKIKEVNYFDHPFYGLIIAVYKV